MNTTIKIISGILLLTTLFLTFTTLFTACTNPQEDLKHMRSEVYIQGSLAWRGLAIGDNELKSSSVTIATEKKINDNEYQISGRITMVDIYGTKWTNNYSCVMYKDSDGVWEFKQRFQYTNSIWEKE